MLHQKQFLQAMCFKLICKKISSRANKLPSALYILNKDLSLNFRFVKPFIPFDTIFQDIDKLEQNIRLRGLNVDIKQLALMFKEYKAVSSTLNEIKMELTDHSRENETLSHIKERFNQLEVNFCLPVSKLPNFLHSKTTVNDEEFYSFSPKPSFQLSPRPHESFINQEFECSHTSHFLLNKAAILELACSDYFLSSLTHRKFSMQSNVDFVKSFIIEGCGINPRDNELVYSLHDPECKSDNLALHLVGGGHLCAFIADLCKMILQQPNLPFKIITSGRLYKPCKVNDGLFDGSQSTCVSSIILYKEEEENDVLEDVVNIITEIYSNLKMHFRLVQYSASNLNNYESLAIGIQMFSPVRNEYIEVGRVSLIGQYVSQRLQIIYDLKKKVNKLKQADYLSLIFVEFVNIRNWIGCTIENTQSRDGDFDVSNILGP